MNLIKRLLVRNSIKNLNWKSVERFSENWKSRIGRMASYISSDDTIIVDLGCGPMWLKAELGSGVQYIGVDYKDRGGRTVVCDFNLGQFPDINADVFFVSGCMEYVENWRWFVERISSRGKKCVISYCCFDIVSNEQLRAKNAWVSSATTVEIINEFAVNNMKLINTERFDVNNTIFVFSKD